jgi:hypothetical protein
LGITFRPFFIFKIKKTILSGLKYREFIIDENS